MSMTCPNCYAELEPQSGVAHCEDYKKDIPLETRCPKRHRLFRVLKACGTVDCFCQNGRGLISKKRVGFVPV